MLVTLVTKKHARLRSQHLVLNILNEAASAARFYCKPCSRRPRWCAFFASVAFSLAASALQRLAPTGSKLHFFDSRLCHCAFWDVANSVGRGRLGAVSRYWFIELDWSARLDCRRRWI